MKISRMSSTLSIVRSGQGHSMTLKVFLHLAQYKLSGPIFQVQHRVGSWN